LYARALLLLDAGEQGPKWIVAKVAEALGTTTRSLEHLKGQKGSGLPLTLNDIILIECCFFRYHFFLLLPFVFLP